MVMVMRDNFILLQ